MAKIAVVQTGHYGFNTALQKHTGNVTEALSNYIYSLRLQQSNKKIIRRNLKKIKEVLSITYLICCSSFGAVLILACNEKRNAI